MFSVLRLADSEYESESESVDQITFRTFKTSSQTVTLIFSFWQEKQQQDVKEIQDQLNKDIPVRRTGVV